jgi:hypothetical protein
MREERNGICEPMQQAHGKHDWTNITGSVNTDWQVNLQAGCEPIWGIIRTFGGLLKSGAMREQEGNLNNLSLASVPIVLSYRVTIAALLPLRLEPVLVMVARSAFSVVVVHLEEVSVVVQRSLDNGALEELVDIPGGIAPCLRQEEDRPESGTEGGASVEEVGSPFDVDE